MKNLGELNIDSFLRLGYFLDTKYNKYTNILDGYEQSDLLKYISEEELIKLMKRKFFEILDENFKTGEKNLIPLSGGLDSRVILGGLLEMTEAKNIDTLTYGSAGTLDFDIGNKVAKKIGTKHYSVNLDNQEYNIEDLMIMSEKIDHQTILFTHPPLQTIERHFESSKIWSGFMGDRVMGAKVVEAESFEDASLKFIDSYTLSKNIKLSKNEDKNLVELIDCPSKKSIDKLTWFEHIDILNRQRKYIAPHVLLDDYKYITPFTDEKWINMMFNIDCSYRKDQYIYERFLSNSYKDLFSIGVKNNEGLPLNAKSTIQKMYKVKNRTKKVLNNYFPKSFNNPFTNYVNFNHEIKHNPSLNKLVLTLFSDLKKRQIVEWINFENILNNHFNNKKDYSMAILILCSLEIHLKSTDF